MNTHLTHQQLCDLLIESTPDAASMAHLATCPACSEEYATLTSSLGYFRQASIQLAERQIAHRPLLMPARRTHRHLAVPAYFAAAAALAIAIFVPIHSGTPGPVAKNTPVVIHDEATPVASTESDEALFDEINQDIAASVPAPMVPLANPAGAAQDSSR